jgi:hypothetical protein
MGSRAEKAAKSGVLIRSSNSEAYKVGMISLGCPKALVDN